MDVKELFSKAENGTLTYDQFSELATKSNAKFVDLSIGNYVSKQKFDDELAKRDTTIKDLNANISTRDKDLNELKEQLKQAGENGNKVDDLTTKLSDLQKQYDKEKQSLETKLNDQAYEFAAREYANSQKFTSKAAKRDFVTAMVNKKLTFENGKIIGADDFKTTYASENEDAFVQPEDKKTPKFVEKTDGKLEPPKESLFHFAGVRKKGD